MKGSSAISLWEMFNLLEQRAVPLVPRPPRSKALRRLVFLTPKTSSQARPLSSFKSIVTVFCTRRYSIAGRSTVSFKVIEI